MRKQYIRKVIWHLGGKERKQKGRFLGAIAVPIIGGLVDKNFKKEE